MKIVLGDVYSEVQTNDYRVAGIIRSVCSARPSGYMFMPKYKEGHWDGYISLSNGLKFPTGLLKRVYNAIKKKGYNVNVLYSSNGKTPHYEVTEDMLDGIILRDYQIDAVNKLLESKRGVAKMATNSGKTEVFAAIIKAMNIPQTLVLVTRKELLYQTAERLQTRLGGVDGDKLIGRIGDGIKEDGNVIVAMIQTLSRMDDVELNNIFGDNQVIVIDECHHGSAEKMLEVLEKIPGYYRYGFSGTPLKNDVLSDLKLISYTGEIVVEVSNEELIQMGHSAKPKIFVHRIESYVGNGLLTYFEAYDSCIVRNNTRNSKIATLAAESNGVVLVIVERIEHGVVLQNSMQRYSVFVNGGDSTEDRMNTIDNMRSGVGGTYIATQIFDEGIDIPAIDTLILAAGGKSNIRLLQRIGRGLRKKQGENELIVHDFLDDTNDYLYDHSIDRIRVYENEGFEVIEC